MAVYTYVAKDEKGGMFTGTYTDVDNASALRSELDKMGYVLIKARRGKQDVKGRRIGGRVKPSDVATFAYKFAGMYTAGLTHDLGRLGLRLAGGDQYAEYMSQEFADLAEANALEKSLFGMNHCEAG